MRVNKKEKDYKGKRKNKRQIGMNAWNKKNIFTYDTNKFNAKK